MKIFLLAENIVLKKILQNKTKQNKTKQNKTKQRLLSITIAWLALLHAYGQTDYCVPVYTSGCSNGARIGKVETSGGYNNTNIVNETGNVCTASYHDYSSQSFEVIRNINFTIKVTNVNYSAGKKVWIDWNNNGIFEDNELVLSSLSQSTGTTYSTEVLVPNDAVIGSVRMRVRAVEGSTNFTACSQQSRGEVEDYTVVVLATPTCSGTPSAGAITA